MLCYNTILDRDHIKKDIIDKLTFFEENKSVKSIKRGFYISGDCGIATTLIYNKETGIVELEKRSLLKRY